MKERKKYSKAKTRSEFPINQIRYDTTNHPIVIDVAKKTTVRPFHLSYIESQYLEFLSNALQVDELTAIRIAVYEVFRKGESIPDSILELADPLSKHRNHKYRSRHFPVKVTKNERTLIDMKATQWSMARNQLMRACLL